MTDDLRAQQSMTPQIETGQGRPIEVNERSGVLEPTNLRRFDARWFTPAPEVRDAVDAYWSVEWDLPPGQSVVQQILEFPAVTLSFESGCVPAPLMLTGAQRRAWSRTITGTGTVFALRLRPAGLATVSDLVATDLDREQPVTPDLDARLMGVMAEIAAGESTADRVSRADRIIGGLLRVRPPTESQILANAVVDALAGEVAQRPGASLAEQIGRSERSIHRALRATLGMGRKAVARRIRLQEVVRRLSMPGADASDIAAALGYVDQAHLIRDFSGVAGMTPGRYVRQLRTVQSPEVEPARPTSVGSSATGRRDQ
ncbi:MAG: AraC family transcriptional regulator [Rhodococcus sp. (in: high G+C Gram-positive bacteria)]